MRAFLFLVVLWSTVITAFSQPATSTLIRRAYLDVLQRPPTPAEMEWYLTYNTSNSYQVAVEYIANNSQQLDATCVKILLNSPSYKETLPRPLTTVELKNTLLYSVGMNIKDHSDNNIHQAKLKLIQWAKAECTDTLDIIDVMCNVLMSRTTSVKEANHWLKTFKFTEQTQGEDAAWMILLNQLIQSPEVTSK